MMQEHTTRRFKKMKRDATPLQLAKHPLHAKISVFVLITKQYRVLCETANTARIFRKYHHAASHLGRYFGGTNRLTSPDIIQFA